jgi:integrase
MAVLSGVLTVAVVDLDWLPSHPMGKVRKPPGPAERVRFLDADERTRLLAACQQSRQHSLYMVVLLALTTGARKTELRRLRWPDVDLEQGVLKLARTKNKEKRAVPVVGQALARLRELAAAGQAGWVFPSAYSPQPVAVDKAWQVARRRAGLVDFHFHDLRHTAASWLAMSGASLREIAEILGHKNIKQTMKYAHLTAPHTRGVLERMAAQFLEPGRGEEGSS